MSSRFDSLKQRDPILESDLVEVFATNLAALVSNLGVPVESLEQFLPEGTEANSLVNLYRLLISNMCTRQTQVIEFL